MNFSNDHRTVAILSLAFMLFSSAPSFMRHAAAQPRRFHLEEAIHRRRPARHSRKANHGDTARTTIF